MNQDFFSGLILMLFSLMGLVYVFFVVEINPDAVFFPKILLAILIICALFLMIKGIKNKEKSSFPDINWKKILILMLLGLAYVYLLPYVGYIISTLFFLISLLFVTGERKPLKIILISASTTFGIFIVFENLLSVNLPSINF